MNVADAMTPRSEVVTAEIPGTRDDVLTYLQERQFSSVPVVKHDDGTENYRGLVSREALINSPGEDQLALLMEEVPTITQDATLEDAARLMVEKEARRVPVVDGVLEGIVTVTDIVLAIAEGDATGDAEVGELAADEVNTTWEGTPLPVAERELSFAGVPYAVVLDDEGEMSGMLTEVDIIDVAQVVQSETETGDSIANEDDEWMWEGIKAVGSRAMPTSDVEIPTDAVAEFMTADLVTVSGPTSSREAAQQMITHDIEQIPLVSGGRLAGIVTDMHLLRGSYE
jgi:IMP dehydrogenase